MSYCRWSTDDFNCDLYCYEDSAGGWTTHVAASKPVGDIPKVDWSLMQSQPEGWAQTMAGQVNAQHAWLEMAERAPIGLPHDGETFHDYTLEVFRDRLLSLRKAGYRFPDYVLADVEDEIREQAGDAPA